MTYFLRSGSRFNVSTQAALDLHETLPVGTYTIKFDKMSGSFYLEAIEDFEIKGKIYGDTKKTATRILDTFKDRAGSTGVMLSGEKGSGKTLLAMMLSLDAQVKGIPTIVINQPWCGDEFNGFMQMIEQPVVVIFDEFEKVYDRDSQEKMLTLLDGVYSSKKLFVITCNDKFRVNDHMHNRPGRIFYHLSYGGLENDFIIEYCQDNLNNKDHIQSVCRIAVMFSAFNFDILKAVVEEMNRYDETPQEAMKILNARPERGETAKYKVSLFVNDAPISQDKLFDTEWVGNPLSSDIGINYRTGSALADDDDDSDDDWGMAMFTVSDLNKIEPETGKSQFVNSKGEKLSLVKAKTATYDWNAF